MALISLAISVLAVLLFVIAEIVRRPKLVIDRGEWSDENVPWQFAAVRISNQQLGRPWRWIFDSSAAVDCRASLTFRRQGMEDIGPLPGRWSARPEPIRITPQGGQLLGTFDPALVPTSYYLTLPATGQQEEMAVAIGNQGKCSAFSAESYALPDWHHPGWELTAGEWDVQVIVTSADGATASAVFSLTVANGELRWTEPQPGTPSAAEIRETFPGVAPGVAAFLAAFGTLAWANTQKTVNAGFYDTANQGALVLLLALIIEARAFTASQLLNVARVWGRGYALITVGFLLLAIAGAGFSFYGSAQTHPPIWVFQVVAPCLAGLLAGIAVIAILLPRR